MKGLNIVIIGASGGIGSALTKLFSEDPLNTVYAFSRSKIKHSQNNVHNLFMDIADECSISSGAELASKSSAINMVVVASGLLHDVNIKPEKSLRDLNAVNFQKVLLANTIGPALVAKHFLPTFERNKRAIFAAISARVGSISDNRLGGWYAYRASKAALNMLIRTTSIEIARQNN
jgi:NAD(P)-dependent dehydrogenase (short-subunit alcohol dehydrogenase family)